MPQQEAPMRFRHKHRYVKQSLSIDKLLLAQVKAEAARRGESFSAFVEDLLIAGWRALPVSEPPHGGNNKASTDA